MPNKEITGNPGTGTSATCSAHNASAPSPDGSGALREREAIRIPRAICNPRDRGFPYQWDGSFCGNRGGRLLQQTRNPQVRTRRFRLATDIISLGSRKPERRNDIIGFRQLIIQAFTGVARTSRYPWAVRFGQQAKSFMIMQRKVDWLRTGRGTQRKRMIGRKGQQRR